jgi:signal transduction histidine kinase
MPRSDRWQRYLLQGLFIFATVLLSVMAVALVIQKVLVREALELEAQSFIEAYQADHNFPLPRTRNLIGYLVNKQGRGELPDRLAGLMPGLHLDIAVQDNQPAMPVYITDFSEGRLYLVFAGYNVDRLVGWFGLVPVVLLLLIVYGTSWVAYRLSDRAISPVMRMVRHLRDSSPSDELPALTTDGLKGETRELVMALEDYKHKLDEMLVREQRFTSDVSHELRTPITIIDGAAQFLETEQCLSDKGQQRARMIRRACRDISELIDAFLLLGREPGKLSDSDQVNVADVAESELAKLAPLVDSAETELELQVDNELKVPVHRKVIEIIINNLCRNAINYSTQGTIRVVVHENGLTVEDNGPGIDEQLIPHIFDRHIRGRGVQKAGEGLGLNIVKRLCDMNHWQIALTNRDAGGVSVSINMR